MAVPKGVDRPLRPSTGAGEENPYAGLIGRTIDGRYVVEGLLGQGGMGAVFRAEQLAIGRPVALKVLHPSLALSQAFHDRFRREAEFASRLRHPHIVTVFDFGRTEDGVCYYVMEMLEGRSLHDLVRQEGPLPIGRAAVIAEQIASALGAAHGGGVIHRDLKPDNVFVLDVDGKDFIKVLDFGLVKLASGEDEGNLTRTGQIVGTPQYMSPEQASGDGVDVRTDIYALGGCIYFMLAGAAPFRAPTSQRVIGMVLTQKPPRVDATRLGASIPEPLQELLDRTLAKEREERPATAERFVRELQPIIAAVDDGLLWAKPAGRKELEPPAATSAAGRPRKGSGARDQPVRSREDSTVRSRSPFPAEPLASPGRPSTPRPQSRVRVEPLAPAAAPPPPARGNRAVLLGVAVGIAAAVVAGGGLLAALWPRSSPAPAVVPPPVAVAPAPPSPPAPALPASGAQPQPTVATAPPRPEVVEVRITSRPEGATVKEAGVVVGVTPATLKVARSRAVVNYTLELVGHASVTQGVDLSVGDSGAAAEIDLTLVPLPKASPSSPAPGRKPKKEVAAEAEVPIFGE